MTPNDSTLLREFSLNGSETAFGELMRRYLPLIYSAAFRQANGDSAMASDICQSVFIDLARKGASLRTDVVLAAWLHRATRLAALAVLRAERRRIFREDQAFHMQQFNQSEPEPDWNKLRPMIDAALDDLGDKDRQAVLLRYFQERSLREIGVALGVSENAARMRVDRALQRLRDLLGKRGIVTTCAGLSAVLTAHAVQTVPAGLAVALAGASLAAIATTTVSVATSASTLGLFQLMTSAKIKLGLAAFVAAGVLAPMILQHQAINRLRAENEALRSQQTASKNTQLTNQAASSVDPSELARLRAEHSELLRSRGQINGLRAQLSQTTNSGSPSSGLESFNPVEQWKNEGLGTPAASLQTRMWSEIQQDRNAFLQSIAVPEGVNPDTMSVVTNMLAFHNWPEVLKGYRVIAVNPLGEGLVEVQVQMEWKTGKKDVVNEVSKRFGNEWKSLVFSWQVDENHSTWAFVHSGQLNADGVFVNGIQMNSR